MFGDSEGFSPCNFHLCESGFCQSGRPPTPVVAAYLITTSTDQGVKLFAATTQRL